MSEEWYFNSVWAKAEPRGGLREMLERCDRPTGRNFPSIRSSRPRSQTVTFQRVPKRPGEGRAE